MPEVIEVKKYKDFLKSKFKNNNIISINILNGRYKKHGPFNYYKELVKTLPFKVLSIDTKGKFLYMKLSNNFIITVTLGLSGGWVYKNSSNNKYDFPMLVDYLGNYNIEKYKKNALNHLNVEFVMTSGTIYFFDVLSFGTIKILTSEDELKKKLDSLAHDIMDEDLTFKLFKDQITKKNNLNKYIGNVLVNQKVISGLGNYLRSDVLWLSKISPFRLVKDLSDDDLNIIYSNARLLTWGDYDKSYALKKKFIDKNSVLPKDYGRNFYVYKQEKDIYDKNIIKEELYEGSQKRFIYWVQKLQV
jgi:endonuclease-8